jgi:hypothetical protein
MSDSKISCPNDDGFCDARFVFSHHTNHTASAKHVTMVLMFLHAIRLSLVRLIHKLKLSPVIINRISMRRLKWIMRRVNYQIVSHMIWIEMKALQWLVTSVDALWFSFAHLILTVTWANRRYHVQMTTDFLIHVLCFLTTQTTLQVQNMSQWSSCFCTLLGSVRCTKSSSWNWAR